MNINSVENDNLVAFIRGVPVNAMASVLPSLIPMLEKVVTPKSGHCVESVLAALLRADKQLWIIGDFKAFTITTIQHRPVERVLWVDWMSGDDMPSWMSEWARFQEILAKDLGCTAVEFAGRIGYKRFEKLYSDRCTPINTLYRCEVQ